MDLIHKFLNVAAYPFTFLTFCFVLPPFYLFKLFSTIIGFLFTETVLEKVVLVTGASSGIGEQLAYEYGKRGAFLAIVARRKDRLQRVADRARELGSPEVITVHADVSKVDDCRRIVEETINHFGKLDHLVNNAGITSMCLFEEMPNINNFRTIMDTNFWGSVYTTRFAIPHLRNSKGKIVVLSSSASWLCAPRMNIYNASKAALLSFFDTLRTEVGSDIGITIVTPGFIESELTQGKFLLKDGKMEVDQDLRDVQIGTVPVGTARGCAKAIVNGVCRGDKYLMQPFWYGVTYLWKVFCPDAVEWTYRMLYLPMAGAPPEEAPSKKALDLTGAKRVLYPPSIQTAEPKVD